MNRNLNIVLMVTVGFLLTACNLLPQGGDPIPLQKTPVGINGQWSDANGIVSSFQNGIFETRAADTREKLSEGNYTFRGQNFVEIEVRSIVRGTVSQVNCSLSQNSQQLFCTTNTGAHFSLNRKA